MLRFQIKSLTEKNFTIDPPSMLFLKKRKQIDRSILITYQVGASYQMNDSIKRGVTC